MTEMDQNMYQLTKWNRSKRSEIMRDAVFWDMKPCDFSEEHVAYIFRAKNSKSPWFAARTYGKCWYRCKMLSSLSVVREVLSANQGDLEPSTLKTEAICCSEKSVLRRTTRHSHNPEEGVLHCYRHKTLDLSEITIFREKWRLLGCYAVWLL
jgi:hypothetical protein